MQHITQVKNLQLQNTAVALGKFDGFHRGHQLLLQQVRDWQQEGYTGVIFTFSSAGRQIGTEKHIDSREEKLRISEATGIQILLEYPFSEEFAAMSPETFVRTVLVAQLGVKAVAVGSDFRFGSHRQGDAAALQAFGKQYHFQVKVFDKLQEGQEDISSSVIRRAIEGGDMKRAAVCLGRGYTIAGTVVYGNQLGHTIGIPTANLKVPEDKLIPPFGVYAVRVHCNQGIYYGIANLGCKPTVSQEAVIGLETYIFDFREMIYGAWLAVELLYFVRPEKQFQGLEELTVQMYKDIELVKQELEYKKGY